MLKKDEIDYLLLQYLQEECDPATKIQAEAWIQEQPEHLCYFNKLRVAHIRLQQAMQYDNIQGSYPAWYQKKQRRRFIRNCSRVAAILVLLIGAGLMLYWNPPASENPRLAASSVHPGSSQAVLHLSTGQSYHLSAHKQNIKEEDGTIIAFTADGSLHYSSAQNQQAATELANRLEVPRGGEFKITLSDGTEVWLNSETELQYPAVFSGPERLVHLQGEAYFKVTKDQTHPFIVQAGGIAIKVYGTQFNISTHDRDKIETVLVEGHVSVIYQQQEQNIKPSQKATFHTNNNQLSIQEVNTLPYIAWKEGNFVFHNEDLGSIMEKLARWYDLEVFYVHPEKKNIRLSGILERYKNVDELFHHFEKISTAHFTLQGQTVMIE